MADSLIEAELLAACSGLGYSDGIKYQKEADCLETVKDLIRYLRRDDDSHQIRRALGESKVLKTDLLPMVKFHSDDKELFDVTLRLLVNLTNPVLLLFKEELPEEKMMRQHYMQMLGHQLAFKEAFADAEVWNVLVGRLGEILDKDWEDREEEERLVVERILILARNILVVAASPEDEKRTDDDASLHDQVLWALHLARFEDLLLYIASSNNEQELCMHVIEIISLMLKEQDASQLANAGLQRSQSEKEKDEKELMLMRKREAMLKQQKSMKHYSARHSRFGGTYYVTNMKSISDKDLITHKHISDISSISFDQSKKPLKIRKNKEPMKDVDVTRRSTMAIRLFLQEFCIEFLSGAFNSLMYIVKDNLNRAKAQDHDELYYLWAMKFFLEFNRGHNFRVELITETLNIQSFHYIQTLLENYREMMVTDKKKIPIWSKRMHRGLKAYQELLMTLSLMDKSDNAAVRESSRILKSKVFYVIEYRELVLILLQNYDELKMSKGYLKDLIETTHIFLKLLDGFCGKQRHLIVQKKKKQKRSKKSKTKPSNPGLPTEEELVMKWEEKSNDLLEVIKGESQEELPDTIPYDPVSDLPEEKQKEIAMKRINGLLRKGEFPEAVSLLRSSRELWPDQDLFGASNLDPVEELLCLRMVFMADICDAPSEPLPEDRSETESDEETRMAKDATQLMSEQEFDLVGFVRRFAHTKIVESYALIFENFFNNTDNVNHCILKMFHRLAWDSKLVAIFFQATIFKTFQSILEQPRVESQVHKDAIKFAKFVFKSFVEIAAINPKVFVELLFWKTNKEALEIEFGYGTNEPSKSSSKSKSSWTEEEEDELRRLHEEHQVTKGEGKDILDLIMKDIIDQSRTRRMVVKKLKELHLIQDLKELRNTVRVSAPKNWSEEELTELRSLVEEYIDAIHPIDRIMDHLSVKRPKNRVIEKILELRLVENRKALQKKRTSKKNNRKNQGEKFLEANASDVELSECESESERSESSEDETVREEHSRKTRKPLPDTSSFTPAQIHNSLSKVIEIGLKEAVEWIADLLQETADEREKDGDFESIPLVSVSDICNKAMEQEEFLELLQLVGIRPPQNHQEMFWRIPSHLSIEGLRKRSRFLSQGLNRDANGDTAFEEMDSHVAFDASQNGEREDAQSPSLSMPANDVSDEGENSVHQPSLDSPRVTENGVKQKRGSKRFDNDNVELTSRKRKKRRIIATDDDMEDVPPVVDKTEEHEEQSRIYDSEDSSPVKSARRRALVLSDDDEDNLQSRPHVTSMRLYSDDDSS